MIKKKTPTTHEPDIHQSPWHLMPSSTIRLSHTTRQELIYKTQFHQSPPLSSHGNWWIVQLSLIVKRGLYRTWQLPVRHQSGEMMILQAISWQSCFGSTLLVVGMVKSVWLDGDAPFSFMAKLFCLHCSQHWVFAVQLRWVNRWSSSECRTPWSHDPPQVQSQTPWSHQRACWDPGPASSWPTRWLPEDHKDHPPEMCLSWAQGGKLFTAFCRTANPFNM